MIHACLKATSSTFLSLTDKIEWLHSTRLHPEFTCTTSAFNACR
uniref:Uncharacterized protein n=1 Tax=Anguilla anguilla TaxID=7936 RepID=A0A0E9TXU6_ANGAN